MTQLARVARWDAARTLAIGGHCRGRLLGPWGDNLRRRHGTDAVARIRRRLPASVAGVSDAPDPKAWVPVVAQVCITEAIIDEFLAGDALALSPLLLEDTRRASSRAGLAVLRRLGPRGMFKMAPRTHKRAYDMGSLTADVSRGHAELTFAGATLFGHPTWRLLQVMAQETLLRLADVPCDVRGVGVGEDGFVVRARW